MSRIPSHSVEDAPESVRPLLHEMIHPQVRSALMLASAAASGNEYTQVLISTLALRLT